MMTSYTGQTPLSQIALILSWEVAELAHAIPSARLKLIQKPLNNPLPYGHGGLAICCFGEMCTGTEHLHEAYSIKESRINSSGARMDAFVMKESRLYQEAMTKKAVSENFESLREYELLCSPYQLTARLRVSHSGRSFLRHLRSDRWYNPVPQWLASITELTRELMANMGRLEGRDRGVNMLMFFCSRRTYMSVIHAHILWFGRCGFRWDSTDGERSFILNYILSSGRHHLRNLMPGR